MNTKPTGLSLLWLGLCLSSLNLVAAEPSFRFEGGLMDGGVPANGAYDMTFELFNADSGGTSVGVYTNSAVEVTDGLYEVALPFSPTDLNFANRWIEIAARPEGAMTDRSVLSPRTLLSVVPYASRAALADSVVPGSVGATQLQAGAVTADAITPGAITLDKIDLTGAGGGQTIVRNGSGLGWESLSFWSLMGNAGTVSGTDFIGTTDDKPLEFRVNNRRALLIVPNAFGANIVAGADNNMFSQGTQGATISGGLANTVGGSGGTVSGGQVNVAGGPASTVGGGFGNTASGTRSVVGGGAGNTAGALNTVVGGGSANSATGTSATVAGGNANQAVGAGAFVGGGNNQRAGGGFATVSGGFANQAAGDYGYVGGGRSNVAAQVSSVVGGGEKNAGSGSYSVAGGGRLNRAEGADTVVAGGHENLAKGNSASVGGGWLNQASGAYAAVPGGVGNQARGYASFAAGQFAAAAHDGTFVWADHTGGSFTSTGADQFLIRAGGGVGIGTTQPEAMLHVKGSAKVDTIQIGESATPGYVLSADASGHGTWQPPVSSSQIAEAVSAASGTGSGFDADLLDGLDSSDFALANHSHDSRYWSLGGNSGLDPSAYLGTTDQQPLKLGANGEVAMRIVPTAVSPNIIAGHPGNSVAGDVVGAVIAGGGGEVGNNGVAADFATVGGGSGNLAAGMYSTVPGGLGNTAAGDRSLAAGHRAQADHDGAIVLADGTDSDFHSTQANEFSVRALGGIRLVTGQMGGVNFTGARLAPGSGSWSQLSDRNAKKDIQPVDAREVLERVASLPVATWTYRTQEEGIRHMGPMAQDFHAAFGLGEDERMISSVDTDGVALAAIKGLNEKLDEKSAEVETLKLQNAALLRRLEALEQRLK